MARRFEFEFNNNYYVLNIELDENGETSYKVDENAYKNRFKGFISHYHVSKGKIDCANLDLKKILGEIKDETD